ncbi:MAG: leucine-rich repeat domain-containing protein [Paludibacteraceae bacterium]|nr:leucine-rich repeat domain-containing protein [Paludibacteraceae bacterium]
MKKTLFILLALTCTLTVNALTVTVDELQYRINISRRTASVVEGTPTDIISASIPAVLLIDGTKFQVTSIGRAAFAECTILEQIHLPEGLLVIGESAFEDCVALKHLEIPSTVEKIGDHAFWGCELLEEIELPAHLKEIGAEVFGSCAFKSLHIPAEVSFIGEHVAVTCPNLCTFTVDPKNKNFDARNNCNALIHTPSKTLICGCASSTIPEGIVCIQNYAFEGCWDMASVELPKGLKQIGEGAFKDCFRLAMVNIPAEVTAIGKSAFEGCNALRQMTLPEGLVILGDRAFRNCCHITDTKVPQSVTIMGEKVFECIDESRLVVEEEENE